jgi:hypothetical protein
MYSQRKFTPGNNSNAKRVINYVALYNDFNPNSLTQNDINCSGCVPVVTNKNIIGSDSNSARLSYNTRVSQIVNINKGGNTQFGNFYLDQPLQLNYLGRAEGMPGGSGRPPKNQFN